jgi:hypothetical protein
MNEAKPVEYIDLTPAWIDILPCLLMLHGQVGTRATAFAELKKMAEAADLYNLAVKEGRID